MRLRALLLLRRRRREGRGGQGRTVIFTQTFSSAPICSFGGSSATNSVAGGSSGAGRSPPPRTAPASLRARSRSRSRDLERLRWGERLRSKRPRLSRSSSSDIPLAGRWRVGAAAAVSSCLSVPGRPLRSTPAQVESRVSSARRAAVQGEKFSQVDCPKYDYVYMTSAMISRWRSGMRWRARCRLSRS